MKELIEWNADVCEGLEGSESVSTENAEEGGGDENSWSASGTGKVEIPTLNSPQTSEFRMGHPEELDDLEQERERRIYRGRTVAMLRRYMRYSMETGRLPSLLGREFFRAKVTSYTVVTFEDRVIFVHDMERCLEKLDEFSRQLIARFVLQEHDRWATARLLNCNEKTIRRLTPLVLDQLSEILLDVGLLDRIAVPGNSCQEGSEHENFVSDCEDGKNNF